MKFRTMMILAATALCLSATAIPNYGDFTDGRRLYDVRGDFDYRLSFSSLYRDGDTADGRSYHFSLTASARGLVVDSLDEATAYPFAMQAGDTVQAPQRGEAGIFFYDTKGRPYASLKKCDSDDTPERMRRRDSLLVIAGDYEFAGTKQMAFRWGADEQPVLSPGTGLPEEKVEFCADVVHNGRPLMHIKTAKRRWLLELTDTGLNIYSAVWSQAKKQYVRGGLQRKAAMQQPRSRAFLFFTARPSLPFADILDRYYTKAICQQVTKELMRSGDDFPISIYCDVLRRMGEGKVAQEQDSTDSLARA